MRVIHLPRRKLLPALLILLAVLGVVLFFTLRAGGRPADISADGIAGCVSYLETLGWQVEPQPIETLDLQLPEKLEGEWDAYAKLQKGQGLPFSEFAGQAVKRYTYTVTNYPEIPQGVQANLYLWGDQIIGGDVIFTGQGGFQTDLAFPKA